jgi:hypothetical protein
MKKLLLSIAALMLTACSEDSGSPKLGQYIYQTNTVTASVQVLQNLSTITVYENGKYKYQYLDGRISGTWPAYTYSLGSITLQCTYSSPTSFAAVVSSDGSTPLPTMATFTYDNTVLDANGDGVLDSWQ